METPNDDSMTIEHEAPNVKPETTSSYERAKASFAVNPLSEELRERITSALVLVAVFLTLEILGGIFFTGLVIATGLLMLREWDALTEDFGHKWKWYGIAYVALPCMSLIWLRNLTLPETPHIGMGVVLYLVLVVSATDVGAYLTGKKFGRVKLAPAISPGKTWEGLAGGVIASGLLGFVIASFTSYPETALQGAIIGMLLAFVAQIGDLFESWLKRKAGVKDSSNLIPGHGGVLDRVDGLMSASVLFAVIVWISW